MVSQTYYPAPPSNPPESVCVPTLQHQYRVLSARPLKAMAPSAEDKAKAVDLKNKGNEAFKKHDWPTAIDFYCKAIELDDTEPTYYANRAQVGSQPHNGGLNNPPPPKIGAGLA